MTPEESVKLLERLLARGRFDPATAWEVFKDWARQPADCESEELAVSLGYFEEDGLASIEFRRAFEDPRTEWDFDVFMTFYSTRPDAPRLAQVGEYSGESEDLAEFFARVEELPGFTLASRYPYWEFEVTRS
jgi:hypothetical protein